MNMGGKPRVYIIFPHFGKHSNALEILGKVFEVIVRKSPARPSQYELGKLATDYEALIIGRKEKIDKRVISSNHLKLRHITVFSTGLENIDLNLCQEKGISVHSLPYSNTVSVAEFTIAGMLNALKKLPQADKAVRQGNWDWRNNFENVELKGKTVGIIGSGRIGRRVIYLLSPFNVRILCHSIPAREKHFLENRFKVHFTDLQTLLIESDIVTVHVALTPETKNMLGKKELSLMKKHAILVNNSRGEVVDTKSLIKALESNRIGGAVLDVFEKEPLPQNHPLLKLPNVYLSPHTAGLSKEAWCRREINLAGVLCNQYQELMN